MITCTHTNRARTHTFSYSQSPVKHMFCDDCWKTLLVSPFDFQEDGYEAKNYTFGDEIRIKEVWAKEDAAEKKREASLMKKLLLAEPKEREVVSHNEEGEVVKEAAKPKQGSIASVIDPLLFSGAHTIKEIAELVAKQLNVKKKFVTNVHVRANMLKAKGYKIEKSADGKIKLFK